MHASSGNGPSLTPDEAVDKPPLITDQNCSAWSVEHRWSHDFDTSWQCDHCLAVYDTAWDEVSP